MRKSWVVSSVLLSLSFVGNAATAFADPPVYVPPGDIGSPAVSTPNAADPQARVGRVSLIDGTVSSHTPDQNYWSYATLNYPVTSGSSFWTEPGARTEIQVGSAALRLDSGTEVDINELDDRATRVEVTQGTVNLHVGNLSDGISYEVMTPHENVLINQPGTYRINAGTDTMPAEVAVLRGQAQIADAATSVTINAGETAFVPPNNLASISVLMTNATPFDNWSLARDNYEEPRKVVQYVSPEMTGYEDLETYGTWSSLPNYNQVWFPNNMPAGWQPYRYGRWVWVSPWGWTWVDEAPWGFAPFHYGRWINVNNQWGWVPGRIVPRPVYAPALVAFVGGNGWSLSITAGNPVGWFPLGPGEAFHPGYHTSPHYVENVNVTNVTNVTNIVNEHNAPGNAHYANRNFATIVPANVMTESRPVAPTVMRVSPEILAHAPVTASARPPEVNNRPLAPAEFTRHSEPAVTHAPTPPAQPVTPAIATPAMPHVMAPQPENSARPEVHAGQPVVTRAAEPSVAPEIRTERPAPEHAPGPTIVQRTAAQHPELTAPRPMLREIPVQHPAQTAPLTPSHQGWVRPEPPHEAPKAEAPKPEAHPEPHADPHAEHPHEAEPATPNGH